MKYQLRFRLHQYSISGIIINRYYNRHIDFDTQQEALDFKNRMSRWMNNRSCDADAIIFIMKFIHSGLIDVIYGIWEIEG